MPSDSEPLPGYDIQTGRFIPPTYLGKESQKLIEGVNQRIGEAKVLDATLAFGSALAIATDTPLESLAKRSYDLSATIDAMSAVSPILRHSIKTEITTYYANLGNYKNMSKEERNYWEKLIQGLDDPQKLRDYYDPHKHNVGLCNLCGQTHEGKQDGSCLCGKVHGAGVPR